MFEVRTIQDKYEWKGYFEKCVNQNLFCTWEWGEYKSSTRKVERLAFFKKGTFIGITQINLKEVLSFKLGWGSSGICLTNHRYLSGIIDSISEFYNLKRSVIRFNFFDNADGETSYIYDSIDILKPVPFSINSGYTVRFTKSELDPDPKKYESNTRYYFKKSLKEDLSFSMEPFDEQKFIVIHNSMAKFKNKLELSVSIDELKQVKNIFGDNAKMGIVRSDDQILSACLILFFGKSAYYFLAGATEEGRNKFASFYMVHELIKNFSENNIESFDFGGISPFLPSVRGINRFKMGYSGKVVKYIGERNLTNSKLLNFLFNFYIWIRFRSRS